MRIMSFPEQKFYKEFNTMITTLPFENHALEYEDWFDKHKAVFDYEVEALRSQLPFGKPYGIEVGLGTGKFTIALGITQGVEPAAAMRKIAFGKGINVVDAIAEKLPFNDSQFDFVLMASCVSYFIDINRALKEANRVLKKGGNLIIGFIDKNSLIGRAYEARRQESIFYRQASFYTPEKIAAELKNVGFTDLIFSQTLFENLDEIKEFEPSISGYGLGSFVVTKATKQ